MNVMHRPTFAFTTGWITGLGALAVAAGLGCAEGSESGGGGGGGADAGRQLGGTPSTDGDIDPDRPGSPDASPFTPDADFDFGDDAGAPSADAAPGTEQVVLTHNASIDLLEDNFAGCVVRDGGDGPIVAHARNNYFRHFNLDDFGIQSDFVVDVVHIGVSRAEGTDGEQPVGLAVGHHAPGNAPDPGNVDVVASGVVNVSDRELAFLNVAIGEVVPAGQSIYVELALPDGQEDENVFLIGVNQQGETEPAFFSSPDEDGCGISFDSFPAVGFANRWVVAITGTHQP